MQVRELAEAASILKSMDDILIVSHVNPDGDTLGSALALCYALRKMGKRANVNKDPQMALRFDFLFEQYIPQVFEPKFIVSVDVPSDQTLPEGFLRVDLCIDHHKVNSVSSAQKLVWPEAAATGEIIFDLIRELKIESDEQIAICLYTSIATDTGCFRYRNTTARSHEVAAALMSTKADFADVNRRMFELETFAEFELKKQILSGIELFYDGKLAVTAITKKMLLDLGITESQVHQGLASESIRIEGVKVGVLLKERENGVRVSFRTVGCDATKIASHWGGGGHAGASGCFIEKPLQEAKEEVIKKLGDMGFCND